MKTFKEKVIELVKKIPSGSVVTYKFVATKAGNSKAARVVGIILSRNQDMNVPCHRVIRSDGSMGGYNGLRGKDKKKILQKEKDLLK